MILWISHRNTVQRAELACINSPKCSFNMLLASTLESITIQPEQLCGIEIESYFNIMFVFQSAIEQTDSLGQESVFWVRRQGLDKYDQRVLVLSEDTRRHSAIVRALKNRSMQTVHIAEIGGVELDENVIIYFNNATRREA